MSRSTAVFFRRPVQRSRWRGVSWSRSSDPPRGPEIRKALGALLARPGAATRLVCVEDAYIRRSDLRLENDRWAYDFFFCGEVAYRYFLADAPLDEIIQALGGAEWRPEVGVVTALPSGLATIEKGDMVASEELEKMADTAHAVVVGAWDEESLCFWEPARA